MCHIILRVLHLKANTEPTGKTIIKSAKETPQSPPTPRFTQISAASETIGFQALKLKQHIHRQDTLLAFILPIRKKQNYSEKALQWVEVPRAILRGSMTASKNQA